jgi:peptide maturation system protein (TIGR04066 family)
MKVKKKIVVYPYDASHVNLFRYKKLIPDFDFVGAVSPIGWSLTGTDIGESDGGDKIDLTVVDCFSKVDKRYDFVFIAESEIKIDFFTELYPVIRNEIVKGKSIICGIDLNSSEKNELVNLCTQNGSRLSFINNTSSIQSDPNYENLKVIETPVVFVLGSGENTRKFDIQLQLKEQLEKRGYKISQIGSKNYCRFFDFHSYPDFMFSTEIESSKIVKLNTLFKNIEMDENPDIFIIGIPGGMLPYNSVLTNRFGITAFEVAQAIQPDFAIYSAYYNKYLPEYFNEISLTSRYRLGFEIDCFNIAPTQIDWNLSNEVLETHYSTYSHKLVNESLKIYNDLRKPVVNIFNSKSLIEIVSFLENTLINYRKFQMV